MSRQRHTDIFTKKQDLKPHIVAAARAVGTGLTEGAFRSDAFHGAAGADDSGLWVRWREAWLNPGTGRWEVTEHSFIPSNLEAALRTGRKTSDVDEKKALLHDDLCFFDAVHLCAEHNYNSRDLEKFSGDFASKSLLHFVDFAEAQHIAFDTSGMPLVTGYGRILSQEATYDARAREVAAGSSVLDPKAVLPAGSLLENVGSFVPVPADAIADLNRAITAIDAKKRLDMAREVQNLHWSLANAVKKNFVRCADGEQIFVAIFPLMAPLFWIQYASNKDFRQAVIANFPRRDFARAVASFRKAAQKLDDEDDKKALETFRAESELVYKLLQARLEYKRFMNGRSSERRYSKLYKSFEDAARISGKSRDEIEAYRKASQADIGGRDFVEKILDTHLKNTEKLIDGLVGADKKLLPKGRVEFHNCPY